MMTTPYTLEICVETLPSAVNAWKGGADRIELCQQLQVGGLTPSYGMIKAVRQAIPIEIHVLIRPRAGDFVYSAEEWEIIREDIRICKQLGVEGVVFGGLWADQRIDVPQVQACIREAQGMHLTFHRAFDLVPEPILALEQLKQLGIQRLLTSGQAADVYQGRACLKALVIQAGEAIAIMPGGGVEPKTLTELLTYTGAKTIHTSARWGIDAQNPMPLGMGTNPTENSIKNVRTLADILMTLNLAAQRT